MDLIFLNRFYAPDHSATSQMLTDLAVALAGQGQRVQVVTSRERYLDAGARLSARETLQGVEIHRVWTSRFGRSGLAGRAVDYLSFYLSAAWRLRRLARPGDLVVAMTDPPLLSVLVRWALVGRRVRRVNWLQDLFPEVAVALRVRLAGGAVGRVLQGWRDVSLRSAALNVVIGERMAERLRAVGVAPARIRVIHNWADGAAIRPLDPATNPLRRAWGLEHAFVVGYSGNLGRAHEVATVWTRLPGGLRAFAYFFYRDVIRLGFLDGQAGDGVPCPARVLVSLSGRCQGGGGEAGDARAGLGCAHRDRAGVGDSGLSELEF